MKLVTTEQMRAVEAAAAAQGVDEALLMENAGVAVAQEAWINMGAAEGRVAVVLAGPGNNGGDGLAAARNLKEWGAEVSVFLLAPRPDDDPQWRALQAAGIEAWTADDDPALDRLEARLGEAHGAIDALIGTGTVAAHRGRAGAGARQARGAARAAHLPPAPARHRHPDGHRSRHGPRRPGGRARRYDGRARLREGRAVRDAGAGDRRGRGGDRHRPPGGPRRRPAVRGHPPARLAGADAVPLRRRAQGHVRHDGRRGRVSALPRRGAAGVGGGAARGRGARRARRAGVRAAARRRRDARGDAPRAARRRRRGQRRGGGRAAARPRRLRGAADRPRPVAHAGDRRVRRGRDRRPRRRRGAASGGARRRRAERARRAARLARGARRPARADAAPRRDGAAARRLGRGSAARPAARRRRLRGAHGQRRRAEGAEHGGRRARRARSHLGVHERGAGDGGDGRRAGGVHRLADRAGHGAVRRGVGWRLPALGMRAGAGERDGVGDGDRGAICCGCCPTCGRPSTGRRRGAWRCSAAVTYHCGAPARAEARAGRQPQGNGRASVAPRPRARESPPPPGEPAP